eukprot:TRINITY_DN8017_c0_g2_i1.p1 TRINITY_DN8017_c0_g2~~TRINITY_DN8017_c0_g2_i1.p1  ORF type:complete len:140 (-),score=13.15 TRINITY_DN8017_c0_g2_i1:53-472(-)
MSDDEFGISCSPDLAFCTDDTSDSYAYVIVDDPTHTIYLCPRYWTTPSTGFESNIGLLIHEVSHFDDVKGNIDDDMGLGCPDRANSLPAISPYRTWINAWSYECFAEDIYVPPPPSQGSRVIPSLFMGAWLMLMLAANL